MNATYDPQAAAHQTRTAYRDMTAQLGHLGLDTAIPESVRALAEKTVAQTREAYDLSKDAFDASVTTFERSFDAAGQGATAFNRKIVDIARRNVDTSFDLAKSPASAKNSPTSWLQAAHWRVRRIDGSPGRSMLDQGDSRYGHAIKAQTARGVDGRGKGI
jgi:hypothetical protein